MSKNTWLQWLALFSLLSTLVCCTDQDSEFDFITYDYRVVNSEGIPTNSFVQGENVFFQFLVINESENSLYMEVFNNDDFFLVKNAIKPRQSFGRSFNYMFCELIPGVSVSAMGALIIEFPWVTGPNPRFPFFCDLNHKDFLPTGTYVSRFSQTLTFRLHREQLTTSKCDVKLLFRVQ